MCKSKRDRKDANSHFYEINEACCAKRRGNKKIRRDIMNKRVKYYWGLLALLMVFLFLPKEVKAAHTHSDGCYFGTKHICSAYGGSCYTGVYHVHAPGGGTRVYYDETTKTNGAKYSAPGGCYTKLENYYCEGKNCTSKICNTVMYIPSISYISKDSTTAKTTKCTYCGVSKTCYQWYFGKRCHNCANVFEGKTGAYYCSAACMFNQHKTVTVDVCKKIVYYCPGKHARYTCSCGKTTSTIERYNKTCGKINGGYYDGNTLQSALCNQVVISVKPVNSGEQVILQGDNIDVGGLITYMDGHTEIKTCQCDFDATILGKQEKTIYYQGAFKYNLKTKGSVESTTRIIITQILKNQLVTKIVPNQTTQTVKFSKYPDVRATVYYADGTKKDNVVCSYSGYASTKSGKQEVTLSYGSYRCSVINVGKYERGPATGKIIVNVMASTNNNDTDGSGEGKGAKLSAPALAVKGAENKIYLAWNKVSKAKKYKIYRSTKKASGYTEYKTVNRTSFCDKAVKKGKTYYYKIKAISSAGSSYNSKYSNLIQVMVPKITSITKIKRTSKTAILNWKKVKGSGYVIYRSTSKSKGYKKIAIISTGATTKYVDQTIIKNKIYYYKIKAFYKSRINTTNVYIYGTTTKAYKAKK